MTSSSDSFPFGIADVVELLGLTVRRRLPSSLYLNCPFCGDQRGRLNVNTDKNVWRCNRCGAAGGMLALYDPPGKSGAKYIWLSSIGKPHGVTSGSPLHFVGEPFAKTVYVTEGLLKADIAYCLTGRSFVAVAGVNSLNGLESALRCMAQNGTKLVVEAYDMDKLENEYVASAAEKVQQIARVAGLQRTSLVWNTAYKGIDDWQLALRQEEAKEKAA